MERKKLLLIAVSVGVFLVIVIGASIVMFTPRPAQTIASSPPYVPSQSAQPASPAENGPLPGPALPPGADTSAAKPPVVSIVPPGKEAAAVTIQGTEQPLVSARTDNVFYFNGENITDSVTIEKLPNGNTRTVINVPKNAEAQKTAKPAASVKPGAAEKTASAASVKPVTKPAAAASVKPVTKPAGQSDFWVQTGSFSKKSGADSAKEFLAKKGIVSIITDSNVNGTTFYRVRVGPYTSKSEAEYWLALIKEIDGMKGAQVWTSRTL